MFNLRILTITFVVEPHVNVVDQAEVEGQKESKGQTDLDI